MSIVYWLARGSTAIAGRIPRPVRHSLGKLIGTASYLAWPAKRRVTCLNMAHVLGRPVRDPVVRRLARRSWTNYGRYAADFMNFGNLDVAEYEREVQDITEGVPSWVDYIEASLKPHKGGLIVSAHFGNWDLAGAFFARHTKILALVESFKDVRLNALIQKQRQDKNITVIPMEGSLRPLMRALQRNEFSAVLMDRPLSEEQGIPVTFFGRVAYVPAGAGTLAYLTGAALLPGFVWYGAANQVLLRAFPPIFPDKTNERTAEVARLTQYLYTTLEEMVRAYPDQWYMFRQFWPDTVFTSAEAEHEFLEV